jgi:hypothetical protein
VILRIDLQLHFDQFPAFISSSRPITFSISIVNVATFASVIETSSLAEYSSMVGSSFSHDSCPAQVHQTNPSALARWFGYVRDACR